MIVCRYPVHNEVTTHDPSSYRGAYRIAVNGQAERSHSDTASYKATSSAARSALTQDRTSAPGPSEGG